MKLKTLNTTLLIIFKDNKVLLGEKKRGFAKGTLIGIGGKQDPGETNEQAMVRETQEEIGVTPIDYRLIGEIFFDTWYKGEHVNMRLNIYTCDKFAGEVTETDEMKPGWYDIDNVPYDRMLQDDLLWMPMAIAGKKFKGNVVFNQDLVLQNHHFEETEELSDISIE